MVRHAEHRRFSSLRLCSAQSQHVIRDAESGSRIVFVVYHAVIGAASVIASIEAL
jgi:hypothetical protein